MKSKSKRGIGQPTGPTASVAPRFGTVPTIEVSDTSRGFFHRIVCGESVGVWATYQGIATLKVGEVVYCACTDFFNGLLPTNRVFKCETVSTGAML